MTENLKFDNYKIYAMLSTGVWTDITADYMQAHGASAWWGISGNKATDLLAGVGSFSFTLKNNTGEYYPDGPSVLTGWKKGIAVKITFTYLGIESIRFYGYIDGLDFQLGNSTNEANVRVTVLDWMEYARRYPILSPSVATNQRADQGIASILANMPIIPRVISLSTGTTTFPAIFDSTGAQTTAMAEMAKLINSEWAYLYLEKDTLEGEKLVLENSSTRSDSSTVKTIGAEGGNLLNETGGYLLNETGGKLKISESQNAALTGGFDPPKINYGDYISNYFTVTAYPKRVDTNPTIVYKLDNPIPISAGGTVTFRATYKDQASGAKINAVPSSMLTPEVPGAADPYLMALLHFTSDVTDSTGRHTWTQNDVTIETDVYTDGYGTQRISGNIIGPYGLFGGYANYYITAPSSSDFDFGSGPFTISWWEAKINRAAGNTTFTRDMTASYPPYLIGATDGTNMLIYMSSNGTSWDIANGLYLGPVNASRWTHYEVCRDEHGWFMAYADGVMTNKWYSALAFPSSTGTFSIGRTQNTNYAYMGIDEFSIRKGQCLHTIGPFDPPLTNGRSTLIGDYLMNTAENGTGTDISSDLVITATYDSVGITYSLHNNNASLGYIVYLTARGYGVYAFNPIDIIAKDDTSILDNGYQAESIQQQYQQNTDAGGTKAAAIVASWADAKTEIKSVSFYANTSYKNMQMFLHCDVGDLITVSHTAAGFTDTKYFIQSVSFSLGAGGIVKVTYGLSRIGLTR